jgi:hypothetical protein
MFCRVDRGNEMNMSTQVAVPENVEIAYRVVGRTHVFSTKGINGLLHVGSRDQETAFAKVIPTLNSHVSNAYGCEVAYRCTVDYKTFRKHLEQDSDISANFLRFKLDKLEDAFDT